MRLPFSLPPLTPDGPAPLWNGKEFKIGEATSSVLEYSINQDGWNDDLTYLHEESAGNEHFMDRASREHALSQLTKHIRDEYATILEIGCSSGFMLELIKDTFPKALVIGADVVVEPLQKLAQRLPNTPLIRFDLTHCVLPDNSIDAIVMLNVLEHIEMILLR